MNQITTKDADNYITKNYNELLSLSNGIIASTNKFHIKPEDVISEAYINCITCINNNKITEEYQIRQFIRSAIYLKITQSNSTLNNRSNLYKNLDYYGTVYELETELESKHLFNVDETITLLFKEFKLTLCKEDLRMFEIMYEKHYDTAKKLAEYLNISKTSAYKSINKINDLLRLYIKNNNNLIL